MGHCLRRRHVMVCRRQQAATTDEPCSDRADRSALKHEGGGELHVEGNIEGVDKLGHVERVEAAIHERHVEADLLLADVEGIGQ